MSRVDGTISGSGTGTTITAATSYTIGHLQFCCNSVGRVFVRMAPNRINRNVVFHGDETTVNLAVDGGPFGGIQAVNLVYSSLAGDKQRIKDSLGTSMHLVLFDVRTRSYYDLYFMASAAGTMDVRGTFSQ